MVDSDVLLFPRPTTGDPSVSGVGRSTNAPDGEMPCCRRVAPLNVV
jgi:hypothetical protein